MGRGDGKEWYGGGKHLFYIWEAVKLTTIHQWRLGVHVENSLMALTLIKDSWSVVFEHLSECPAQDVEENKHKQWLVPTSALNPLLENKVDKCQADSKQVCSYYTTSYRQWVQKELDIKRPETDGERIFKKQLDVSNSTHMQPIDM